MSQNNAVGWFEIYVSDMERAVKFYETVMGVRLVEMIDPTDSGMKMMNFPQEGDYMAKFGASGALVKMEGFGPGAGGTIVYFSVEDCAVESSRVEAAGGEVMQPKQSIGEYGAMSLCKDTEGNIFGLHSMK